LLFLFKYDFSNQINYVFLQTFLKLLTL